MRKKDLIIIKGIVDSVSKDGLSIHTLQGGHIIAPFDPAFRKGDRVECLKNHTNTGVVGTYPRGGAVLFFEHLARHMEGLLNGCATHIGSKGPEGEEIIGYGV